jgi:hypothetical protein
MRTPPRRAPALLPALAPPASAYGGEAARTDVVVENGVGLEESLAPTIEAAGGAITVTIGAVFAVSGLCQSRGSALAQIASKA